MTDATKIKKLRMGLMCAVIHLFKTDPKDVIDTFTLEELELMVEATKDVVDESLDGIYKDLLDMTK